MSRESGITIKDSLENNKVDAHAYFLLVPFFCFAGVSGTVMMFAIGSIDLFLILRNRCLCTTFTI